MTDATLDRMQGNGPGDSSPTVTFAEFFAAHFRHMVQLAGLLGADDPEDVAQEAFARLQARHRTLRDPASALPYLRATVCNLSRSRLRHLGVVRRHERSLLSPAPATPEQSALDNDERIAVVAAMRRLPLRQREVLVLRYWSDLSEADIADTLGIAKGSVKSAASRGIATLQLSLRSQW